MKKFGVVSGHHITTIISPYLEGKPRETILVYTGKKVEITYFYLDTTFRKVDQHEH
ncbi:MAG TPA: hypothetical protein VN729_08945 [Ktedonobacteraceae bacterium]|nr:hypothetical protein [Ktedonobacteraceae bacterium]